ncbi:hypothetical protein CkaCkLH20_03079 [Colletotrichum karsti]|uniref:Uncharacterized protein n=1 Tax=Colletotrichum karsti TaxID=1095194 RepID=A0A9P6ICX1_9PEZI|nr:uncharacterized protein CkaCkLH20_03079 [Colletotrichum karsti]KAF9879536.1 hypothetical protein CkaCkLH20_03079 [Colletotrichum karsti]
MPRIGTVTRSSAPIVMLGAATGPHPPAGALQLIGSLQILSTVNPPYVIPGPFTVAFYGDYARVLRGWGWDTTSDGLLENTSALSTRIRLPEAL